ncbi:helix-turn-helix transcriptional regulator [Oryzobacter telluris]|uniref:helix-turn-helix transcriptional regulator n=1 Tax=Oryzobacter telluris TaxID=3149179 RepID=UPI00370D4036
MRRSTRASSTSSGDWRPALARGVRAAVARTFTSGAEGGPSAAATADGDAGPVVIVLDDALRILGQTPRTDAHLRALLPPGPDTPPVPAAALNVAAQLLAREAGVDDHPATGRVHLGGGRWMTLRADRLGEGSIGVTLEPSTPSERVDLLARSAGLTPRETELAGLLLTGQDTRHLAHRMGLSEHTVQDHLKAVFAKTGIPGRAALVARILGTA